MEEWRVQTMQNRIDSISYPCTHEYNLENLEPKGHLKKRVELIPENFFTGDNFLDIGVNKGFFSLLAQRNNMRVDAIDIIPQYVELCNDLGINTVLTSFRDFNPDKKYDRIMLGNVMHYMFRECNGYEFISKLAAISKGLVLIEAPLGLECSDLNGFFDKEVNYPSPDRYIMIFDRKKTNITQLGEIGSKKRIKSDESSRVYKSDNSIIKLLSNPTEKDEIRIVIASLSPISNGLTSLVYDDGKFVGWTEEYNKKKILEYKERQKEVFEKVYIHNIFLAKLGYTDVDNSMINFFDDLILFDKGGVYHIQDVKKQLLEVDGNFTIMTNNSYDNIDVDRILKTLKTGDSKQIEVLYWEL